MNTHLIAAPESAATNAVGASGAIIGGLILLALIANDWKKLSKEAKKYTIMSVLMVACLAGGGGVLGGLFTSARTTVGTVTTTLTNTTTGQ